MSMARRTKALEDRVGRSSPLDNLNFDELWGIVIGHAWTDDELDGCAPTGNTYRRLLEIAEKHPH